MVLLLKYGSYFNLYVVNFQIAYIFDILSQLQLIDIYIDRKSK